MTDVTVEQNSTYRRNVMKKTSIKLFIYNPSTREFLGRSIKSWILILLFYVALYGYLALFFTAMITIFFRTLDERSPTWTQENSLIGSNPGMGFRPMNPDPLRTVIAYNSNDIESVKFWAKRIDDFLKRYENKEGNMVCDFNSESTRFPCLFDVDQLYKCKKENDYGYRENKPCIFLKMNKIFGWKPVTYTKQEIDKNEMKMPANLRTILNSSDLLTKLDSTWVSCSDEGNSGITLEYDGHPGFPSYYYPFANEANYHSPLVAIQINNIPIGTTVRINCTLWAKNIQVDRPRRLGMTLIEVLSNPPAI